MINLGKFTPWAKNIYDMYDSRVCNTFVICGNIGDYAFGFYNLTDYIVKLFQYADGFGLDTVITYDSDRGGVYQYSKKGNT